MATTQQRLVKLKRVVDPNDPNPDNPDSYVDVPVTVKLYINDGEGQGYVKTFDSTQQNNSRTVHTHTVKNQTTDGLGNITKNDDNTIDVERIDRMRIRNADQVEVIRPNNNDPAPLGPTDDPSSGHLKTHVLRYNQENMNDPYSEPWIDVEVVDKLKTKGFFKGEPNGNSNDAGQITILTLTSNDSGKDLNDPTDPFNPMWSKVDTTLDSLPMDTNGNPDPVRLSLVENIVNVSWLPHLVVIISTGTVHAVNPLNGDDYFKYNPPSLNITNDPLDPFPDANSAQIAFTWDVYDTNTGKKIDNGVFKAPLGTQHPPYKDVPFKFRPNYDLISGIMKRFDKDGATVWSVDVTTLGLGQPGDDGLIFLSPNSFAVVTGGVVVLCNGSAKLFGPFGGVVEGTYYMLVKLKAKDGSKLWSKYSNPVPSVVGNDAYLAQSMYASLGHNK
jgi:hypothetical protein